MRVADGLYARIAAVGFPVVICAAAFVVFYHPTHEPAPLAPAPATSQAFTDIYDRARWGRNDAGEANSGPGSTVESTLLYRTFLQAFLKKYDIHSVVDAGCGDWEFSRTLDWTGVDYKGYDIVSSVVEQDKQKYATPSVQFFVANIVTDNLPPADLLICKHVLQHLPNQDVTKFLAQLPKYKHVLLTDSVDPHTLSADNRDIPAGHFRPIDLTLPPFNLNAVKVLSYYDGTHMHQVLHIVRPD